MYAHMHALCVLEAPSMLSTVQTQPVPCGQNTAAADTTVLQKGRGERSRVLCLQGSGTSLGQSLVLLLSAWAGPRSHPSHCHMQLAQHNGAGSPQPCLCAGDPLFPSAAPRYAPVSCLMCASCSGLLCKLVWDSQDRPPVRGTGGVPWPRAAWGVSSRWPTDLQQRVAAVGLALIAL